MDDFNFGSMFSNDIIDMSVTCNKSSCVMEGFTLTIEIPEEILQAERLQDNISNTIFNNEIWREIPNFKNFRISKSGKIIYAAMNKDNELADIIPVQVAFNKILKQVEVNIKVVDTNNVVSVQELMAITWLNYEHSDSKRVVLKDGNPFNLSIENIDFEDVED